MVLSCERTAFIISDNNELSEVIKMLGNKELDFHINSIISDNFR